MRRLRTIGSTIGRFRSNFYEGIEPLLATLWDKVIAPAEGKAKVLQERRRKFEAEQLTKPR